MKNIKTLQKISKIIQKKDFAIRFDFKFVVTNALFVNVLKTNVHIK